MKPLILPETEEFSTGEVRERLRQVDEDTRTNQKNKRAASSRNVKTPVRTHATPAKQAQETQRAEVNHEMVWRPAATLDAPPARSGMVQRWIRALSGAGKEDPVHVNRKIREGWKPVLRSNTSDGYAPPTIKHSALGEIIGVGDLILCEMPLALFRSRQRYFAAIREKQTAAAERKPIAEVEVDGAPIEQIRKSAHTVGARRPPVQNDEDSYADV